MLGDAVCLQREAQLAGDGRGAHAAFVGLSIPSYRFYDALRTPDLHRLRALVQRL